MLQRLAGLDFFVDVAEAHGLCRLVLLSGGHGGICNGELSGNALLATMCNDARLPRVRLGDLHCVIHGIK